jgi:hypothetical protein
VGEEVNSTGNADAPNDPAVCKPGDSVPLPTQLPLPLAAPTLKRSNRVNRCIGRWQEGFKSMGNLQSWLKPRTFCLLIAGYLIGHFCDFGWKWLELYMEENFKSAGISVEYGQIVSLASSDLEQYANRVGCGTFERNLDDDVLTNYFVIPLTFRNFTRKPVGSVKFEVDAHCFYAKMIDVQSSVRKPKGKNIVMRHDLPTFKWALPTNTMRCALRWAPQPGSRVNVFCSVVEDRGFGEIKTVPGAAGEVPLLIAPTPVPSHYFFRSTGENISGESELCPAVVLPNPIYLYQPLEKSPTNLSPTLSDNAKLSFLEGRTAISFQTGLDPDATIGVYVLGKVALGQSISPSVKMDGEPGVSFKEENPAPRFDFPYELLNPVKLGITPVKVHSLLSPDRIVFFWDAATCSNYSGMRVFRSRERPIGDYANVGDKIFDGFGNTNTFAFERDEAWGQETPVSNNGMDYHKFFDEPPADANPVVIRKSPPPGTPPYPAAPTGLKFFVNETVQGIHLVDTPPERDVVFTYTFYAFDHAGNQSYPIVVDASLDSSATNWSFTSPP